jgi:type I restriction-modification system DNA methylase subunit
MATGESNTEMTTDLNLLNPRTELEQAITGKLRSALEKRGFEVKHNGTETTSAPGGMPDIEIWDNNYHINVEVTKTTRSSADREMLSIADHLAGSKKTYPSKRCFAVFVSPETHYRMINAIRDHNIARQGLNDQKIMPMSFWNLGIFVMKLSDAHKDEYKAGQIAKLFDKFLDFVDDERVLKVLYEELFSIDDELRQTLQQRENEKWQRLESQIMKDLEQIEEALRRDGIALHLNAIKQLIYLVFIKLYEERKEAEGRGRNWFTVKSFLDFQEAQGEKETKGAIHKLFEQIKEFEEFQDVGLLTEHDLLAEKLDDGFVLDEVIQRLERYPFLKAKVDGLGAVYEVLGRRSGKDTKAGQFFTPANVVDFMVRLAELEPSDVVLDPACGTGRFLVWAMDDMQKKVSRHKAKEGREEIARTRLLGTDNDIDVAKLAKMNMYIHGDGKGNIWDDDGLLLYKTRKLDGKIDVVLTNPPLGDLGYRRPYFDDEFYRRMVVIPRKKAVSDSGEEFMIAGNQMKGGAQFINAIYHYLKPVRDSGAVPEWRGGKMLIILDEAILNTDDYARVRRFIRDQFYIKAVISLTPDTFVPVSRTTTKTSILYAIKKDDPAAKQQEPIFYAHAERVGINTRRRICANDLFGAMGQDILTKFNEFKKRVLASYDGLHFNKSKFSFPIDKLDDV